MIPFAVMRTLGMVLVVGLLGCQPNAMGSGETLNTGPAQSGDDSTTQPADATTEGPGVTQGSGAATSDTGPDPTDTSDPPPLDSTGTPDDSSSSGEPATGGDAPLLVISGAPEYDFGAVLVNTEHDDVLTVTNTGGSDATGMTGQVLGAPFAFAGGSYPGTGGDCDETLPPDGVCSVVLSFTPADLGVFTDALSISYDDADDVIRPLVGGGEGQSDNLIQNPGGETPGSPVPSWTSTGAGVWFAGDWWRGPPNSRTDQGYLGSYSGPNRPSNFFLEQDIDVTAWAATIDLERMRFSFAGWVRTWQNNDDEYRIRVRYLDAGGHLLQNWGTGWSTGGSWHEQADERIAPAGTRTIRVELGCRKDGEHWCDAYYDDLDLHAFYP